MQIVGGNAYAAQEAFEWLQQESNVHAYDHFFGRAGLGRMPKTVKFPCCSQFAVTAKTVHIRSRFFWQQNLHYLMHNDIQASNLQPKSHMVGEIPQLPSPCKCSRIKNTCTVVSLLVTCTMVT